MRTSVAPRPAVAAAFESFIDYAGLFPPAQLSPRDATAEYAGELEGAHAWMLGRFIVPLSLIGELDVANAFRLSVIVAPPVASTSTSAWFDSAQEMLDAVARLRQTGTRVEALEISLPQLRAQRETHDAAIGQLGALLERAALRDLPSYIEWPRNARWCEDLPATMAAAARAGLGAKLRCGGLSAELFPGVEEVASFIAAAHGAGVRFKATAGLHHPIRARADAPGGWMHGFLNLLTAAVFAPLVDLRTLVDIVAEEDPGAFAFDDASLRWRDQHASVVQLQRARGGAFTSYGSCSFTEPVEDLIALGILPAASPEVP
jgi:hypothetical protein